MKNLVQKDLMNIIEYEKVRNEYRKDIIDYKKCRRIHLGPFITITFENRKTLAFQIQEMMRAERMVHNHQIQEELDVYNSLLPKLNGLSATLFIEITEEAMIRPILNQFIGLTEGETLWFDIDGKKVFAEYEAGREKEDKISSVHYLHFTFNNNAYKDLTDFNKAVKINIKYKDYSHTENLSSEIRHSLAEDLKGV